MPPAEQLVPKELSWLAFNERVLQEAENPATPLMERVRFLGIFSNNQDEFYRVRVADVRRLASFSSGQRKEQYDALLTDINKEVMRLQRRFDRCYLRLLRELAKHHVHLIDEHQLTETQFEYVCHYFRENILNYLEPFFIDDRAEMPLLNDGSIYLAIQLDRANGKRYGAVEIPTAHLPRFVPIPPRGHHREKVFIVLENMIRCCLPRIFHGILDINSASAYTFKISRDAELELGEGITQSHIDRVSTSLKRRTQADPVRFVYDRSMPRELFKLLTRKLRMGRYDSFTPGGRYHNAKDFIDFPQVGPARFRYRPLVPMLQTDPERSIFDQVAERDRMLYYPYHDYQTVIDLLATAAIDPQVRAISITLYRVASDSHVIGALINAARNQKKVTAVVELRARFDELANIQWARALTEAGVEVIFGVPGLKVHAKLIVIERFEGGASRYYTHVGTGNFNEKTARFYCDLSLLTAHQEIGRDAASIFDFVRHNYKRHQFRHLSVSPYSNREALTAAIDREIAFANDGRPARIELKCNNLVDEEIVNKLYEASAAGVDVRLIVRSMFSLIPGQPGLSDNIRAISIVDKYLEHTRIYIFHNGGSPLYYISSADLMTRNLDYRVEVTCPVYDPDHRQLLRKIFDLQWRDTVKARSLAPGDGNTVVSGKRNSRSQDAIERYLKRRQVEQGLTMSADPCSR